MDETSGGAKKTSASSECGVPGGGTLRMAGAGASTGRIQCRKPAGKLFKPGCIRLHLLFKSELGGFNPEEGTGVED